MHIRATTDPISMRDVVDPNSHPCIYEGDGVNGLEIYFENEANRDEFLAWEQDHDHKIQSWAMIQRIMSQKASGTQHRPRIKAYSYN